MKSLAVLLVTFGLFAHATNNASCEGLEPGNLHTAPKLVKSSAATSKPGDKNTQDSVSTR